MVKHLLLVSLLLAALVCYFAGSTKGVVTFITAAIGMEFLYYFEAFGLLSKSEEDGAE